MWDWKPTKALIRRGHRGRGCGSMGGDGGVVIVHGRW